MPDLVDQLFERLRAKKWRLVTAESCTGGMLAAVLTDKPGSSEFFERGFVTYSNRAKMDILKVDEIQLSTFGAVSEEVAQKMASGALKNSQAHVAISITGVAGPGGGTKKKPVGLVYIGYAIKGGVAQATEHRFTGNREQIRLQATREALRHLVSIVKTDNSEE